MTTRADFSGILRLFAALSALGAWGVGDKLSLIPVVGSEAAKE